mgnify:FL=1
MTQKDDLDIEKYPKKFQVYLKEEIKILKNFVKENNKVLDVGCGTGRAIPEISPLVSRYVGIDIDEKYLSEAKKTSKAFDNVKIIKLNVENLSKMFKENEFDKSFCLFNTISCFKDYNKALKEIHKVTKDKFYFSVCAKGSKDLRQEYYDSIGVKVKFDKNETSYSSAWGEVKAFSKEEIKLVLEKVGFKIEKIILIEGYSYCIIASK